MRAAYKAKLDKLKRIIEETSGCAVAYSGGVDSSLVMKVAHEVLGERSVAVIATSSTYSKREFREALEWVKDQNIGYRIIHFCFFLATFLSVRLPPGCECQGPQSLG